VKEGRLLFTGKTLAYAVFGMAGLLALVYLVLFILMKVTGDSL
jgi:hypothetical protein